MGNAKKARRKTGGMYYGFKNMPDPDFAGSSLESVRDQIFKDGQNGVEYSVLKEHDTVTPVDTMQRKLVFDAPAKPAEAKEAE